ncbi:hypothetical protein ACH5RR_009950 [Cinchona calisaya]|uniref:Uncharacterized protein n=1 Tax=Cinchona calisaya TaxID=153742 RepID=A0ABD3AIJ0_9GENT
MNGIRREEEGNGIAGLREKKEREGCRYGKKGVGEEGVVREGIVRSRKRRKWEWEGLVDLAVEELEKGEKWRVRQGFDVAMLIAIGASYLSTG